MARFCRLAGLRPVKAHFLLILFPVFAQAQSAYRAPRSWDGQHPNLTGIWEALDTANWDLQDHPPYAGPMWEMGAIGAVPAGQSVVEGGNIPYLPAALEKKQQNFLDRRTADPEAKCYLPGIPRATYMPYPFQIVQSRQGILFVYEYATANRLINMGSAKKPAIDTWMGTNNGHWENDTLVIDVTGLNGLAWLDRAGDWASNQLHVVERFTPTSANSLTYEATIEDPSVFSRPWKISMPLYRRLEKNAQILEFKCVEFSEDLLYGKYRKPQTEPTFKGWDK